MVFVFIFQLTSLHFVKLPDKHIKTSHKEIEKTKKRLISVRIIHKYTARFLCACTFCIIDCASSQGLNVPVIEMTPHFILLLALWPAVKAVLSEEIEIEKNYMTPIQVCTFITAANVTTAENGPELLDLEGRVSVIFKLTPIVQYQHQVAM
jgi:hypothetical protein